jgi:lysophospholipase L1-like esterase
VFLGYDAAKVMINLGDGSRYCDNKCRQQGKARTIELFKQIENGIPGAIIIPRVPGGDKSWAPADGVHISGPAHAAIASHIWPYIKP